MPATVRKLSISDTPVDINTASAQELRDALPGIGDILARRIVLFRDEHGPFERPEDLMRVPGLNGKRLSKFAPRVSLTPPTSGFRMPAASTPSSAPMSDDYVLGMPIFAIESEPLPGAFAPSMSSLLPNGPEESMGHFHSNAPVEPAPFVPSMPAGSFDELTPSSAPQSYVVGGSLLSPPRTTLSPNVSRRPMEESAPSLDDDAFHIPLNRPWRVGLALGAIALFSAILGSTFAIRSQEGGPRARIEQRVGQVEGHVADLGASVRVLEGQAATFASSINALDARISHPSAIESAPRVPAEQRVEAPRDAEPRSAVRHRVRQAMRELDSVAAAQPKTP